MASFAACGKPFCARVRKRSADCWPVGFQLVAVACKVAGQDMFLMLPLGTPQQTQNQMQIRPRRMTVHAQGPSFREDSEREPRNTQIALSGVQA